MLTDLNKKSKLTGRGSVSKTHYPQAVSPIKGMNMHSSGVENDIIHYHYSQPIRQLIDTSESSYLL